MVRNISAGDSESRVEWSLSAEPVSSRGLLTKTAPTVSYAVDSRSNDPIKDMGNSDDRLPESEINVARVTTIVYDEDKFHFRLTHFGALYRQRLDTIQGRKVPMALLGVIEGPPPMSNAVLKDNPTRSDTLQWSEAAIEKTSSTTHTLGVTRTTSLMLKVGASLSVEAGLNAQHVGPGFTAKTSFSLATSYLYESNYVEFSESGILEQIPLRSTSLNQSQQRKGIAIFLNYGIEGFAYYMKPPGIENIDQLPAAIPVLYEITATDKHFHFASYTMHPHYGNPGIISSYATDRIKRNIDNLNNNSIADLDSPIELTWIKDSIAPATKSASFTKGSNSTTRQRVNITAAIKSEWEAKYGIIAANAGVGFQAELEFSYTYATESSDKQSEKVEFAMKMDQRSFNGTTYKITNKSIEHLKKDNVPSEIIKSINNIKNKTFYGEKEFEDSIEIYDWIIDGNKNHDYKGKIKEYAEKQDYHTRVGLNSYTIKGYFIQLSEDNVQDELKDWIKRLNTVPYTIFVITKQSVKHLKSKKVPEQVLVKLHSIQNIEFQSESEFLSKLKETIGKEDSENYKSLIIEESRHPYTSFTITDSEDSSRNSSLSNLRSEGVPDDVLTKLQAIQNKEFLSESRFLSKLEETIGTEQTNQYKSLILKSAAYPDNQELYDILKDFSSDQGLTEGANPWFIRYSVIDINPPSWTESDDLDALDDLEGPSQPTRTRRGIPISEPPVVENHLYGRHPVWGLSANPSGAPGYNPVIKANIHRQDGAYNGWQPIQPAVNINQIQVGGPTQVLGVSYIGEEIYQLYLRTGISDTNATGESWSLIDGNISFKRVSIGTDAMWGVDRDSKVYIREGITRDNPNISTWNHIDDGFKEISIGPNNNVWAIKTNNNIYFRIGITPDNLTGDGWSRQVPWTLKGSLQHMSVGPNTVWGLYSTDPTAKVFNICCLTSDGWQMVDGQATQLSVAHNGEVWLTVNYTEVGKRSQMAYRAGITDDSPVGAEWISFADSDFSTALESIAGNVYDGVWGLRGGGAYFRRRFEIWDETPLLDTRGQFFTQLSVGATGQVWGLVETPQTVNSTPAWPNVVIRSGISRDNPTGNDWLSVDQRPLYCVSAGNQSVWGVDSQTFSALYRVGVTAKTPQGTGWEEMPGVSNLSQISVGDQDQVWALGGGGSFFLNSATTKTPKGDQWTYIDGRLSYISVGNHTVWGIGDDRQAYFRTGITATNLVGNAWEKLPFSWNQEETKNVLLQHVVVGANDLEVWAVGVYPLTQDPIVMRRMGVTHDNLKGDKWEVFNGELTYRPNRLGDGNIAYVAV